MKIVVSNMVWIDKSELRPGQIEKIRKGLTVLPKKIGDYPGDEEPKPIEMWRETFTQIGVPRGYFFANASGLQDMTVDVSDGVLGMPYPLEFHGILREDQANALAEVVAKFRSGRGPDTFGGLFQASPGYGKTVWTCALIAALQVPTVVVVHKEFLLAQWRERIEQFLPNALVGLAQQDTCDYVGKHIVLGMVHSLASHPYSDTFWKFPGLVVTDECFPAGTSVHTLMGARAIETIRVGDRVWSVAGEDVVVDVMQRTVDSEDLRLLVFSDGSEIICTKEHPFLVWDSMADGVCGQGWLPAESMLGQYSVTNRSNFSCMGDAQIKVVRIEVPECEDFIRLGLGPPEGGTCLVYNLSVAQHPSYVVGANQVLVHNCHRIGAYTWSPVPPKFYARWQLGLSATLRRKDGADAVFWNNYGSVLYAAQEKRMRPKIRRVYTTFELVKTPSFNPSQLPRAILVRFLTKNPARNTAIAEQVILAVKAGRKLLVLSERLEHLDLIQKRIGELWKLSDGSVPTFGKYVGGRTQAQLDQAALKQIVLATVQFASEGLDIPPLDTLFLVTPVSDVEQAVGRILRPSAGKKDPVVVDFHDDRVAMCRKSADYREVTYKRLIA